MRPRLCPPLSRSRLDTAPLFLAQKDKVPALVHSFHAPRGCRPPVLPGGPEIRRAERRREANTDAVTKDRSPLLTKDRRLTEAAQKINK